MPKMVDDGAANDISSQPMQEACVIATSNNNMMSKRCLLASWLLKVALLARSQASCGAAAPVDQKKYWLSSSSSCELSSGRLMSHVSSAVEEGVHRQSSADRVLSDPSTIRFPDRSLQDFDTICASAVEMLEKGSEGALDCSCIASEYATTCYTPQAICPNQTQNTLAPNASPAPALENGAAVPEDPNNPKYCFFVNATSYFLPDISGVKKAESCSSFAGPNPRARTEKDVSAWNIRRTAPSRAAKALLPTTRGWSKSAKSAVPAKRLAWPWIAATSYPMPPAPSATS